VNGFPHKLAASTPSLMNWNATAPRKARSIRRSSPTSIRHVTRDAKDDLSRIPLRTSLDRPYSLLRGIGAAQACHLLWRSDVPYGTGPGEPARTGKGLYRRRAEGSRTSWTRLRGHPSGSSSRAMLLTCGAISRFPRRNVGWSIDYVLVSKSLSDRCRRRRSPGCHGQ